MALLWQWGQRAAEGEDHWGIPVDPVTGKENRNKKEKNDLKCAPGISNLA